MNSDSQLQGTVVRHDFTKDKCRWGWCLLNIFPCGEYQWNAMFVGRGVKDGHEIALSIDGGVAVLVASHVKYEHNPPDMMKCRLTLMPDEKTTTDRGAALSSSHGSQFFVGEDGKPFPMPTGKGWKPAFTSKVLEAVATLSLERQIELGAYIMAAGVRAQKKQ